MFAEVELSMEKVKLKGIVKCQTGESTSLQPIDDLIEPNVEYSDFEEVAKTHPLICSCTACKIAGW